jgi:hypothetical protein
MTQAVSCWPLTAETQSVWDLWWTEWHWDRFFSEFFGSPLSIQYTISPLLCTHLSLPHEVCDSPDQAARYHTLGPKLWASSLTWHLAGTEERSIMF